MKNIAIIFFLSLALVACGTNENTDTKTQNIVDLPTLESTEQWGWGEAWDQKGSRK